MRNHILIILLAIASGRTVHATTSGSPEKILGYQPSKSGVTFQVTSGGCTQREDFTAEVKRSQTDVTELTFIRIRPDNCHPFLPTGIRFRLSYDELGLASGERFIVKNQNGVVHGSVWDQEQLPELLN